MGPEPDKNKKETQPSALPNIVIFEDNEDDYLKVLRFIGDYPNIHINNFADSMAFLEQQSSAPIEERVQIGAFVVDGNLSIWESDGIEGRRIIHAIRSNPAYNKVPVIGNSYATMIYSADYNMRKDEQLAEKVIVWIQTGRTNA